ncbi:MAG: heme-binding protein [Hyphomicrobium sp.]|jgi:uncharacterized protein GlcG (DUF336 family)
MRFQNTIFGLVSSLIIVMPINSALSQVAQSGYSLPLDLAVEAAHTAVKECAAKGWPVTATVVDTSGLVKAELKGDHSVVHTKITAYRKAYTVVSMGPIFGFDTSSAFIELVKKYQNGAGSALTTIPDVIALAGGVAIKRGSETVAAIGVGGAPGGDKDEACAAAGVAVIAERVNASK